MTSKRGKPEIVYDILSAIHESDGRMKPTRLLYKSNLSYARLKLYLETLIKQGLLEAEDSREGGKEKRKMIKLTQKGYRFLAEYKKVHDFIESFGITEI